MSPTFVPSYSTTRMLSLLQCVLCCLCVGTSFGWNPSSSAAKKTSPCTPKSPITTTMNRRQWLQQQQQQTIKMIDSALVLTASSVLLPPSAAQATSSSSSSSSSLPFRSAGFDRSEYTNSIVASRDTNISPKEVYDTLQSLRLRVDDNNKKNINQDTAPLRALDVGSGAGVSTQVLYELGYTTIDACDWSDEAWNLNVIERGHCPPSVQFYHLDDERFLSRWKKEQNDSTATRFQKYNVIVFNFAINRDKAVMFAQELLTPDGLLLAPVNTQQDYWLKQAYKLYDRDGEVLWTASDVGAWSVQFQPDVTQPTCQGIWCAPYNGFQKLQ